MSPSGSPTVPCSVMPSTACKSTYQECANRPAPTPSRSCSPPEPRRNQEAGIGLDEPKLAEEIEPPEETTPEIAYGLESAKPDLQSTFKKPGGGVVRRAPRARARASKWEMVRRVILAQERERRTGS